ncbi:MAG: hypothetical protein U9Q38_01700 [Thermodesulfobacteriota bacterium]|nr:hypothetical protein [Thermodesulfobacteriota bacterium]
MFKACKTQNPILHPKLSGFLLDLRRPLAHKGFVKILDISTGMPACPVECEAYFAGAVFPNPYASRSQHISSQKIAQLIKKWVKIIDNPMGEFDPARILFKECKYRDKIKIENIDYLRRNLYESLRNSLRPLPGIVGEIQKSDKTLNE